MWFARHDGEGQGRTRGEVEAPGRSGRGGGVVALADVCEEQGRGEEAAELRRQAKRSAETVEVSQSVTSSGKVLRQKTQVNIGGAGLPLSEMSNMAAMLRGTSAPAPTTRQKVGRNEPCPCGSGKKFKKCCDG